jgi:dTDP-4-dehydrorhamnose reductase
MKIAVTGAAGMLGSDVMVELMRRGHEAVGLLRADMDITDGNATAEAMLALRPDAVVHCAAYTAVDAAENDPTPCIAVNAEGTKNLAYACRMVDTKLVYVSTDYVFGGVSELPHKTYDAAVPLNIYGTSKLLGEYYARETIERLFIVRTSWLYGKNGRNFVSAMFSLSRQNAPIRCVCDEIGRPTYARDLARLLADMAESERYGVYHASGAGDFVSFYDYAREIFRQSGVEYKNISPVTAAEYGAKAKRPKNSRLDTSSLTDAGFSELPDWREALTRYLQEIGVI